MERGRARPADTEDFFAAREGGAQPRECLGKGREGPGKGLWGVLVLRCPSPVANDSY